MKAKFVRSLVLVAGLAGVLLVPSWAQPDAPTQKHVAQQTHSVTALKIEHVRAEMMAQWLKPPTTPRTKEDVDRLASVLKTFGATIMPVAKQDEGNKHGGSKGGALYSNPGLESVLANPRTNEIWVKGTPESITRLREIVSFLDQPVRSVEVKVQFVEVDKSEVADLGVAITDNAERKAFILNREFQDKIKTLINSRRARVLHNSQVTAFNNSEAKASAPANGIAPALEWSITPTIQNDNTITLFFTPQINSKPKLFLTTVANVKSGDIMVLNIRSSEDERREMLAIVSTQIVEN